ncbi:MAG TPA: DUF445 domain-containing protein [Segeticoccus sp.]|uniref:DUF445 domain-containing protein n=1 Tax=Segeticoccus sp. TaxID=2706531 RepID=UPI002D7F5E92|nr:DUF445 domain-containing protein [Segeticoccus sp.]HET8600935.1 DUF445 domain-containing protein [Segeticoccus sp.]
MRSVALGLLVLAAVVFGLTLHRAGWLGYVHAAAEAAMVGALADWFAVTALFRHPLGLPIPHTAIIPERKQALGRSLEEFVTTNFLTEENARERLAAAGVSRRLGEWLAQPRNARRIVEGAAEPLGRALRGVDEADVRAFTEGLLLPRLSREPVSPIAGRLLGAVVADGAHHGLVDLALRELDRWLRANDRTVARVVRARAPWWTPRWLDDKVVERVQAELVGWVADVSADPEHPAREAVDRLLAEVAQDLQHDTGTMARVEALKERLLAHPQTGRTAVAVWDALRVVLLEALADPQSTLRTRALDELVRFGTRLATDIALQRTWDGRAADAVGHLVRTYGRELASVISVTVDRWDGAEAARRIELHVGRDLQFIRINGTVVGALVGLVLHVVTQLA